VLWPLLLLCVAVQAGLGLLAARTYLARHNTLQANGQWRTTKSELSRGLLGAFAYITELQTLAGGRLHLDAWHGFNEVIYRQEVGAQRRIDFDFRLGRDAYLIALFDRRDDAASAGIRLSSIEWRPSGFLELDGEGKFLRREPWSKPQVAPGDHHATVEIGDDSVEVFVDGRSVGVTAYHRRGGGFFGFRGGSNEASVDDVTVSTTNGRVLRESFDSPHGAASVTAATVTVTVLLNLALFALLRWRTRVEDKILGFRFFTLNITLLVIAAALYVFVLLKSSWYPRLDATLKAAEVYFEKGAGDKVRAEIQQRYGSEPSEGRLRLLFVGSSQTWGAGAKHDDETYVAVLEKLLAARHPDGPPIECINAGISSSKAADLEPLLAGEWMALGPRIVVIDLSSNDRASKGRFLVAIGKMIDEIRAAGAVPVLVQEPNSIEMIERGLVARHRELEAMSAERGVQLIAMQNFLAPREETGILYWDKVHLTPYGQRLMAGRLAEELEAPISEQLRAMRSGGDSAE